MVVKADAPSLPTGVELTALGEDFRTDPYPILEQMRASAPVYHDPAPSRYFVTRHEDVKRLLHDKTIFMDPRKARPGTFSKDVIAGSSTFADPPDMLFLDDPDHHRLRSLVSGAFRPSRVERWREDVRALVNSLLDGIKEREFDLVESFAAPMPVAVIARMLGIAEEHHGKFKVWSDTVVKTGFNPFPTDTQLGEALAAKQALDQLFLDEIDQRLARPGDDLISDMLREESEGHKLTREECVDQCRLLLVAGNVTTTDLICNGVKALLDHPDQLQALRNDPSLIGNAVEEILRYDSSVTNTARVLDRDMTLHGCPLQKGDSLHLSIAAANRDPDLHAEPDRFDIRRENPSHVAFGGGRHLCLGAHLARMETQEAILGLITRFPDLGYGAGGYEYHAVPSFRGMQVFWLSARAA